MWHFVSHFKIVQLPVQNQIKLVVEINHSYLESEKLAHFPPKELSNDFTGLVFSYLQSFYFKSNPCILGSILVFSHSIPLL